MNTVPWSDLTLGATVLLAIGLGASLALRSPHERHRAGAATVVALLLWLGLALIPLPRIGPALDPVAPSAAGTRTAAQPVDRVHLGTTTDILPASVRDAARPPAASAVPVPVSDPPATRAIDLAGLAPTVWIAGAAGAVLMLLLGQLALARTLRRSSAAEPWLAALAAGLWRENGPAPDLRVSDRATRPFCCGLRRPVVVIPRAIAGDRDHLAAVLRHEFAHVRHGDLRTQLLFAIAAIPFWWHPLLWSLRARTRFAAELLADDVAATAGSGRHAYARALVDLADLCPPPHTPAPALSMFERETDFSRRMQMLLTRRHDLAIHSRAPARALRTTVALLAVVSAAAAFGRPALRAQEPIRTDAPAADTLELLRSTVIDHHFESTTLTEIVDFYAKLTKTNWVIDHAVADQPPWMTTIGSLDLEHRPIAVALDAITVATGTRWSVRDGVVVIEVAVPVARGEWSPPGEPGELQTLAELFRRENDPDAPESTPAPRRAEGNPVGQLEAKYRVLLRQADAVRFQMQQLGADAPVVDASALAPSHDHEYSLTAIADLATRAIDARGAVEIATADSDRLRPLAEKAVVSRAEVDAAERRAKTAAAKYAAMRGLVDAELDALKIDLEAATRQLELTKSNSPRRSDLESRVRRLRGYLDVLAGAR